MNESEKSKDMPMPSAKAFVEALRKRIDIEQAYSKLCLKCKKGVLLPISRVVDLGCNPVPEELVKRLGYSISQYDLERLIQRRGVVRSWRCSNPECGYEVS